MEADMDALGWGRWWLDGVRGTICWALRTVELDSIWGCVTFLFFFNTGAAAVQHSAGIKTILFLFTFPSQMKLIRADILSQNSTGTSAPRSARQSRLPPFGTMLVIPPGAPRHISEESPEVALCLAPWRTHICPFYDGSCVKLHRNGVDKPFFSKYDLCRHFKTWQKHNWAAKISFLSFC